MSEEINNDQKWKSLWEPALNRCFDEGEIYAILNISKLLLYCLFSQRRK